MPKITFACRQPLTELVSSGGLWDTTLTEEVTTFWSIDLNNMEIWGRASSTKSICSQPPSECNRNINNKSRSQHTVDGISIYTKAAVWGRATSQACGRQGGLRTAWGSHLSTCPSRLWQGNLPGLPVSLQGGISPFYLGFADLWLLSVSIADSFPLLLYSGPPLLSSARIASPHSFSCCWN